MGQGSCIRSLSWMRSPWLPGCSGILGCVCRMRVLQQQPSQMLAGKGCFSEEGACLCDLVGCWNLALCAARGPTAAVGLTLHVAATYHTAPLHLKSHRTRVEVA